MGRSATAMLQAMRQSPVKTHTVNLVGGWDQITPTLSLPGGYLRDVINFECSTRGGYTRVKGYERSDGQASPSDATYTIVQIDAFTNTPSSGDTLTGADSGATGEVVATGSNYIIVTKLLLAFTDGEVVAVGATTIGTVEATTVAISTLLDAQYKNLAADAYRADILVVPGSGPVRGVAAVDFGGTDVVYAFRDNSGGTAVELFKSSASGWVQIAHFWEVNFTAGGAGTPAEGDTLTETTGGETATIKRIVLESGSWAGSDATGRFIITEPSPSNFEGGAGTAGSVAVTISGAATEITFATGGKFEFVFTNFAGQLATKRLYGADGVNRCFEFDGTVLTPIDTGLAVDTPKHIAAHHNHLFVSVASSFFFSAPGLPYDWVAGAGLAGEVAVGDTVTGLLRQPGKQDTAAMAVFARDTFSIMYGTGQASWSLVYHAGGTGALDYTVVNMGESYWFDDRGLFMLNSAYFFGNFDQATLTNSIQPFIDAQRSKTAYCSLSRTKSQYRLFFTDGSAMYTTIVNGKLIGSTQIIFSDAVFCAFNGELANGDEVNYVGAASSGHVYQLEKGTSFDGEPINASLTTNWINMKSPRTLKHFRRGSFEIQGESFAAFNFAYVLGYGSSSVAQPDLTAVDLATDPSSIPAWDVFTWDQFTWDGGVLVPTDVDVLGTAENIEVSLNSTTDYIDSYTVNSLILHYTPRRILRRR